MTRDNYEERIAELKDRYEERINELQDRIYELTEKPKLRPPHPRWKPAFPERYYSIFHNGLPVLENWSGYSNDEREYEIGNIFRTRTEAEFEAERLKVLAEMREWAGSWDDIYVLTYIGSKDIVSFSNVVMVRNTFGEMRFATEKDAKNCIKTVGADRIKKYYFMIPEETNND